MKMRKKKLDEALPLQDATEAFEIALQETDKGNYVLRLYVSGMSPNSQRAVENVRKICAEHLEGRYQLEIIDIYQQPIFAKEGQIVATPTLVKQLPEPLRKFIGDMSQTERILVGLDIRTRKVTE
jgi:circadian clock protein KaiB